MPLPFWCLRLPERNVIALFSSKGRTFVGHPLENEPTQF
nr:MAG TPA: hypothetical protein [Caudoviricetes sp.]